MTKQRKDGGQSFPCWSCNLLMFSLEDFMLHSFKFHEHARLAERTRNYE